MSSTEYRREIGFGLGTFVGVLFVALGISLIILFLSIGLRVEQGAYLSPTVQSALLYGGIAGFVVGLGVRLYRSRLSLSDRAAKYLGTALLAGGVLAVIVSLAKQTARSAPFLTSPTQKFMLLGIALGCLVVGGVLIRAAARTVGW